MFDRQTHEKAMNVCPIVRHEGFGSSMCLIEAAKIAITCSPKYIAKRLIMLGVEGCGFLK